MAKKNTQVPSLIAETFMSVFRVFLVFIVLNNIIWAIIHYGDSKRPSHNTEISVVQDGSGNTVTQSNLKGGS